MCLLLLRESRGLWDRVFADKIYGAQGVVDDHSQSAMDDHHLDTGHHGENRDGRIRRKLWNERVEHGESWSGGGWLFVGFSSCTVC